MIRAQGESLLPYASDSRDTHSHSPVVILQLTFAILGQSKKETKDHLGTRAGVKGWLAQVTGSWDRHPQAECSCTEGCAASQLWARSGQ